MGWTNIWWQVWVSTVMAAKYRLSWKENTCVSPTFTGEANGWHHWRKTNNLNNSAALWHMNCPWLKSQKGSLLPIAWQRSAVKVLCNKKLFPYTVSSEAREIIISGRHRLVFRIVNPGTCLRFFIALCFWAVSDNQEIDLKEKKK